MRTCISSLSIPITVDHSFSWYNPETELLTFNQKKLVERAKNVTVGTAMEVLRSIIKCVLGFDVGKDCGFADMFLRCTRYSYPALEALIEGDKSVDPEQIKQEISVAAYVMVKSLESTYMVLDTAYTPTRNLEQEVPKFPNSRQEAKYYCKLLRRVTKTPIEDLRRLGYDEAARIYEEFQVYDDMMVIRANGYQNLRLTHAALLTLAEGVRGVTNNEAA